MRHSVRQVRISWDEARRFTKVQCGHTLHDPSLKAHIHFFCWILSLISKSHPCSLFLSVKLLPVPAYLLLLHFFLLLLFDAHNSSWFCPCFYYHLLIYVPSFTTYFMIDTALLLCYFMIISLSTISANELRFYQVILIYSIMALSTPFNFSLICMHFCLMYASLD